VVIPYSSKYSSLMYFINTYPHLGSQNKPTMPKDGRVLTEDEVRMMQTWIEKGAKDINGSLRFTGENRKKIYIVNQGCDVVSVMDSETQLAIRYIEVGTKPTLEVPHQVRVSPDGKYWYVIFINNNVMQKFSCSDDSYVGEIPLTPLAASRGTADAQDWNTFNISKDGRYAYCISWTQNGMISKVDLDKMTWVRSLGGLYYPHALALNANEDKVFVGAQTGNFISEIDTSFKSSFDYPLEGSVLNYGTSIDPHDMILAPDKQHLWITCQKTNEVRVFDVNTHQVTDKFTTGTLPQEIIYSKVSGKYFVSCMADVPSPGQIGSVSIIDPRNNSVQKLPVGTQPHGIAEDENKKLIYICSRNASGSGIPAHHASQCEGRNGFLEFFDLKSGKLLDKRHELSVDPYFASARP
jgi:YVTN family beta-propeller protein